MIDAAGVLHSTYQPAPGEDWTAWDPPESHASPPGWHDTKSLRAVTAAQAPGSATGLWVLEPSAENNLHYNAQTGGEWSGWNPPF